jgi:Na+-driven multidrug efflux pump
VAVATVVSQFVCVVFSYVYMVREYPIFNYKRDEIVFDKALGLTSLKLGLPTTLQQFAISFGNVFLQRLVNSFGTDLMAAYTVGMRIQMYIFVPIFALNGGVATFAGQNIGAGKRDRAKRGFRYGLLTSFLITAFISVPVYLFAAQLVLLFGVEETAFAIAVEMLRFISLMFLVFALYLPITGFLQGAGDVVFVSSCTLITLAVRVGISYALVFLVGVGYQAVWYSHPVGWGIGVVLVCWRYLRGGWKTKAVVHVSEPKED